MDRLVPSLIIGAVILTVFVLMALGWRARRRRQSGLARPVLAPASLGSASVAADGWYVATTLADQPLERVAVHGLGFRARATAAVHLEGLVLGVQGQERILIATESLRGAGRATWAIDRVVERDGLILIGWMLGNTPVDTYLRVPDPAAAAALLAGVQAMTPEPATITAEGIAS
ncbi:hypothetical protein [Microcella sp.]|uniref:PH-like domain-containing protein n=1 Tax=Microcella sp. TaxID=1913979 RepID=UPI00299F7DA6|nr:hypothetical protein [Microcella sp.]MDX2025212.1 hypothetical protein [Microcella sp.]